MTRGKLVAAACVMAVVTGGALWAQADVFTRLGANETEAKNQIFSSFSGGSVSPYGTADVFKTAAADARVSMVKSVIAFARTYSTSPDFAKRYGTYREGQKPSAPEPQKTGDQLRAEQRKAMEEAIANAKKMAVQMPSMKADMDKMVKDFTEQLAQIGKDKEATAAMDQMLKQAGEMQQTEYKNDLAAWEKKYPVDPKPMIVARLKTFLDLSATVDFAATTALDPRDKKQKFTNKAYEAKNSQWKMMYRAGKPAVDAAREAAQEWLKAIGG